MYTKTADITFILGQAPSLVHTVIYGFVRCITHHHHTASEHAADIPESKGSGQKICLRWSKRDPAVI